jgi:hypothetical protein
MKIIKAIPKLSSSQIFIEDYDEYKNMIKELKIRYLFLFQGKTASNPVQQVIPRFRIGIQNVIDQRSEERLGVNHTLSAENCFGFVENSTWYLFPSNGFSSLEEYDNAIAIDCHSKQEFDATKNGGYDTYTELLQIQKKGFNSKDDFLEANNMGCDSKEEFTKIKAAGFVDKNEYTNATNLGITTKSEFVEYLDYAEFMKQNNLNTHDEVLLYKYLENNISNLSIETIRLNGILPQVNRNMKYRSLKWFKTGIIDFALFEKFIIKAKNADEYFYNKNMDIFQEKPIVFSNTEIVLDGSNIAWNNSSSEAGEKPLIRNVILVTKDLINRSFISIRIYFDANIEYDIDDKQVYKQLENTFNIKKVPAGQKADKFILDYAKDNKTYVISNDEYNEYENTDIWFKKNLEKIKVQYKIDGDKVSYNKTIEK